MQYGATVNIEGSGLESAITPVNGCFKKLCAAKEAAAAAAAAASVICTAESNASMVSDLYYKIQNVPI